MKRRLRWRTITSLARWYGREYFYLSTPDGSVNNCRRVATVFSHFNHAFRLVELRGYRLSMPKRHAWHRRHSKVRKMCHWAVEHRGWVIDFTWRQFDPRSKFPLIRRLEDVRREWRSVTFKKKPALP